MIKKDNLDKNSQSKENIEEYNDSQLFNNNFIDIEDKNLLFHIIFKWFFEIPMYLYIYSKKYF